MTLSGDKIKLVLIGPTAVGKSELTLELSAKLSTPIISSDSRQSYKYLNIGTAKPSPEILRDYLHYNISVLNPDVKDDVGAFLSRCKQYHTHIKSNILFYSGGSTLYNQAITFGIDEIPDSDKQIEADLIKKAQNHGWDSLFSELETIDPDYSKQMDGINKQRLLRALNVFKQTGTPFSTYQRIDLSKTPDNCIIVGLYRKRDTLYNRINMRVDRMIKSGLIDEIDSILKRGYTFDNPGLNSVGYKEFQPLFKDKNTYLRDKCIENIKTNSRRYAKRQLTWYKRWKSIIWLDMDTISYRNALNQILEFLHHK